MTHFAAMIRLGDTSPEHAESQIARKLAPYEECSDVFEEFCDKTDELREEWEQHDVDALLYNGEFYLKWTDELSDAQKQGAEACQVPFSKIYDSFEDFAEQYHGYERRDGRYGYMHNPNAKWDWYSIGGRYMGWFPIKPEAEGVLGQPGVFDNEADKLTADIVRKRDIDLDRIGQTHRERIDEVVDEWKAFIDGDWDAGGWEGWRMSMINMGLIETENLEDVDLEDGSIIVHPWSHRERCDVMRADLTEEEVREIATPYLNPLRPYAFLDEEWNEPGQMGWFAASDARPDDYANYCETFEQWFAGLDDDDVLVLVDCHI